MIAANTLVDLLHDVLAIFPGYALHEYSKSGAQPVELVSDWYVGLGSTDELFGLVLVRRNLLLVDVVDESCL
jgi:hypothetical protein